MFCINHNSAYVKSRLVEISSYFVLEATMEVDTVIYSITSNTLTV